MIAFKKRFIVVILIAAAGLGGYLLKTFERSGPPVDVTAGEALYFCPMHPTYTADRQGECPICSMSLVKMNEEQMADMKRMREKGSGEEAAVSGYTEIRLSPEKQQLIGIRTVPLVKGTAFKTIRTVGRIAYDPKLYQAQEEYLQSYEAWRKSKSGGDAEIAARAEKLVASAKVKLGLMGLNEELIAELETQGEPDKSLLVAKPGEKVWMYAPVYEYDLDAVKVGQRVKVTAQTVAPGKSYEGTVRALDPVIDPQTRSVNLRAQLENPEGMLRPNVFVNAEIHVAFGDQLVIPEGAILDSGQRQIAFVAKGDGIFEPRVLRLGAKLDGGAIVLEGIKENEQVVDQAAFFVDSESKLKAALSQSSAEAASGHQH